MWTSNSTESPSRTYLSIIHLQMEAVAQVGHRGASAEARQAAVGHQGHCSDDGLRNSACLVWDTRTGTNTRPDERMNRLHYGIVTRGPAIPASRPEAPHPHPHPDPTTNILSSPARAQLHHDSPCWLPARPERHALHILLIISRRHQQYAHSGTVVSYDSLPGKRV